MTLYDSILGQILAPVQEINNLLDEIFRKKRYSLLLSNIHAPEELHPTLYMSS